MGATSLADVPRKMQRNMPKQIPLAIIGRLAIDAGFQGRGIGGALLRDAFRNCLAISEAIGCAGVTVHAIDDDATAFYIRYGMVEFPSGSRTLFLPIETIRGLA
jgi:GNAT superfamily N-acetyltransferase